MADPRIEQLSRWIVSNKDKRGTPEFETVARALKELTAGQQGGGQSDTPLAQADPRQYDQKTLEMAKRFREQGTPDQQRADWARDNPAAQRGAAVLQGVPFAGEYTDEAAGMLMGQEARDRLRALQDTQAADRPWETFGLNLLGGGATAVIGAGLAGPQALSRFSSMPGPAKAAAVIGGGAVAGGTEGYVSGYGAGKTPEESSRLAQQRAIIGTVAGGAIPATVLGGNKVVQRITRPGGPGMDRRIADQLTEFMGDDELGAAGEAAIRRGGPEAMLADAGPGAQALADSSVSNSPAALRRVGSALDDRISTQKGATDQALDGLLGSPVGVRTAQRDIRSQTAGARGSAYDAAYSGQIDYLTPQGEGLEDLLNRAERAAPGTFARANRMMAGEGVPNSQMMIIEQLPDGTFKYRKPPDTRQIDYITRALRNTAEGTRDVRGVVSDEGRILGNLARSIRDDVKDLNPAYRTALEEASGSLGRENAVRMGNDIISDSMGRDDLAEALRTTSGRGEINEVMQGLRTAIDDKMAEARAVLSDPNMDAREAINAVKALSSRKTRDKISMLLEAYGRPDAAEQIFDTLDKMGQSLSVRANIGRNSKTAVRQALNENQKVIQRGGAMRRVGRGEPINAVREGLQAMTGQRDIDMQALGERLNEQLADVMTGQRGQAAIDTLRNVRRYGEDSAANRAAMTSRNAIGLGAAAATVPSVSKLTPEQRKLLGGY